MKKHDLRYISILLLTVVMMVLSGCGAETDTEAYVENPGAVTAEEMPEDEGQTYVTVNDNVPEFDEEDFTEESFEEYSDLDELGRCGAAYANIGQDLMPDEERQSIGMVKPSGWHTVRYDNVDGKYLYNRCHLIGYQLSGENANEENLITGTRHMNVDGMLPFEEMVADYVRETDNHVLYRVTPIYSGDDLVARGVQMEAESVEDAGQAICFNVYIYNSQPGIDIDYATGESSLKAGVETAEEGEAAYIVNTNSGKFHRPDCRGASDMNAENRWEYGGDRESLTEMGYEPCGMCSP